MQAAGKRKNPIRSVQYPASIEVGGQLVQPLCTLYDVSQEGAQLVVADPHTLPNEFTLVLGYEGKTRRFCRVTWRSGADIGVKFMAHPGSAGQHSHAEPSGSNEPAADARIGNTEPVDIERVDIDNLPAR